mmetsp:Transcript_21360/g.45023  ORF Transcript_21360/g.45023 Transcript_21360/m.45023 type:complete len:191 (-) Transcript_21360:268-840(-)
MLSRIATHGLAETAVRSLGPKACGPSANTIIRRMSSSSSSSSSDCRENRQRGAAAVDRIIHRSNTTPTTNPPLLSATKRERERERPPPHRPRTRARPPARLPRHAHGPRHAASVGHHRPPIAPFDRRHRSVRDRIAVVPPAIVVRSPRLPRCRFAAAVDAGERPANAAPPAPATAAESIPPPDAPRDRSP